MSSVPRASLRESMSSVPRPLSHSKACRNGVHILGCVQTHACVHVLSQ